MKTLGPYVLDSIVHGDCLDIMPQLPAGSFDMILCDLPYGTTACAWDSIIPLEPLWTQYKRLIKPAGAIVLTGSQPFTSMLVMSNLDWFRVEWIWEKPMGTNYLNANRDPMKNHENILVFADGYPTYNPQMREGKPYAATSGGVGDYIRDKTVCGFLTINSGFRFPLTVNKFNQPTKKIHPTQKPVALFSYLIRTYTNPGAVILDNCAGSGTTAIAAIETGRNWFCIEKDAGYFEIAKRRIGERLQQPFLFEPPAPIVQPEQAVMSL
jgi:site-specific DNA-methyltransferase (adenine-specific)